MKKIFLFIVAVAAIAACTKSEVQYEPTSEIGFAPVAKFNTKAAVYDVTNTTDYPDDLPMYVFANAGLDGNDTNTKVDPAECTEPYFANAEFVHGTHESDVFGGVTPYYWPNVKSLIFSGFSKSGNVATIVSSTNNKPSYTFNEVWEISINGYEPGKGTSTEGDNDLMWFPTTDESYTKQGTAVPVTMQHSCAWLTFNIKGDNITSGQWEVLDVYLEGLYQKGDVKLSTVATWSNLTNLVEPFVIYDDEALKNGTPYGPAVLTVDGEDFTQKSFVDLVVVPQDAQKLYITYQYKSDPTNNIIIEETKDITLTAPTIPRWEAGYHYIYNIQIGTAEILVQPTANEWSAKILDIQ